jgi:RNA polymerase sigma factor (sigma-70 family)
MDYTLATNQQLKTIMSYDIYCPPYLIKKVVAEMMDRQILNDFIMYHAKKMFGIVKTKQIKLGLEDSDIIQLGLIGIWKALDKYEVGKSSFSTFSTYHMRAEWQNYLRKFNAIKRTMDREGTSMETVIDGDVGTLEEVIPSSVNVEKTVLMKIHFENQLSTLSPLQRTAILGNLRGYQNKEVAKSLSVCRQSVDRAFKRAMEKMGAEEYSLKENCGAKRGA